MVKSSVKEIMEKRGVTLARMVDDTGLAEMTIIRARREQIGQCRLDTLIVIADYLGCTVNDLFFEEGEKAVPKANLPYPT